MNVSGLMGGCGVVVVLSGCGGGSLECMFLEGTSSGTEGITCLTYLTLR